MNPLDGQHGVVASYHLASKLDKEEGPTQVSSLIYGMGTDAEKLQSSAVSSRWTEEQQNNFERVLQEFGKYFVPKRKVIHKRATFHRKSQQVGESIDDTFAAYMNFLSMPNSQKKKTFCDRLMLGLLDQELSQKLQLEPI